MILALYFGTDSGSGCLQFFTSHLYWLLVWTLCHRRMFHHVIKIPTWQPSSKPKVARQKITGSYRYDINTHNFK